jgi:hypothetical protein
MEQAVRAALEALRERNAKPYDGLLGQLPDWVPPPLPHEFVAVRNRLLDSESIDKVQEWMRLWCSPTSGEWMAYVPPEYDRDIDSLVYIQRLVNLGPQAGIDAYLGKSGMEVVRGVARVEHNRKAAKQPRADGLQRVIREILLERPHDEPAAPFVEERLRELERDEVDGVTIESIESDEIWWHDANNPAKSTPLSGLKDRVSRALKQLEQEKSD